MRLTRIELVFEEAARMRTQQFVLQWRASGTANDAEIVRQQFTFAPTELHANQKCIPSIWTRW